MRRGLTRIDESWFSLKLEILFPILIDTVSNSHCEISSQLVFSRNLADLYTRFSCLSSSTSLFRLLSNGKKSQDDGPCCYSVRPSKKSVPTRGVPVGLLSVFFGMFIIRIWGDRRTGWLCALLCGSLGIMLVLSRYVHCESEDHNEYRQVFPHDAETVSQGSVLISESVYHPKPPDV